MDYLFILLLFVLMIIALRMEKGDEFMNRLYTGYKTEPAEDGCTHEVVAVPVHYEADCPTGTCVAGDSECQYGFGQNHWDNSTSAHEQRHTGRYLANEREPELNAMGYYGHDTWKGEHLLGNPTRAGVCKICGAHKAIDGDECDGLPF